MPSVKFTRLRPACLTWLILLGLAFGSLGAEKVRRAAAPVMDPPAGFREQPFTVSLRSLTPGATIYFTTNGAEPDVRSGQVYRGPVAVAHTTVLRAVALANRLAPSASSTATYLFLDEVRRQTGVGFPVSWGTNLNQPVPADYEMDPEIVNTPAYRDELLPALRALPTLSIVMALPDLFDPQRGLYANPRQAGDDWERPASVELLHPDGKPGFQINCGLRIQGGWNRRPEESPKHSFRLFFKKRYGPGKLKFPLFGETGAREFDTLVLRSGCNNTWLHWSGEERLRGEFIRDQWMRDSFRAMGHASAQGTFVHLYLNGLYWGLYNPCERPSAPFVAGHFGGQPEDYDVRNGDHLLEGDGTAWKELLALANAGVQAEENYAAIRARVDLPVLIDYLMLNLYGGNADWDRASNWYAARRRTPPGPWRFFVWDGERTLESPAANTLASDDDQSPLRLFQKLRENSAFRELFAARARHHLTEGGVLTPGPSAARYERWAREIRSAVVAESARWGDYRRDGHRYKVGPYVLHTRDEHWQPEVNRLLGDYFPRRTTNLIAQFRAAGLFPASAP